MKNFSGIRVKVCASVCELRVNLKEALAASATSVLLASNVFDL